MARGTVYGYSRVAVGDDAPERLERESAWYSQAPHYARHFSAMGVEAKHVGETPASGTDLPALLARYSAMDVPVVRALAPRDTEAVLALARAAAGVSG